MKAAVLLTLALASQAMAGRINKQHGKEILNAQDTELKVAAEEATNVVVPPLITGMVVNKAKEEVGKRLKALAVNELKENKEEVANGLQKVANNNINKLKNFADNKIDKFRKGGPAKDGAVDEESEDTVELTAEEEAELAATEDEAEFQRQLKKRQDEMPKWRAHLSRARHWTGRRLNDAKPVVKKGAIFAKDRAGDGLNAVNDWSRRQIAEAGGAEAEDEAETGEDAGPAPEPAKRGLGRFFNMQPAKGSQLEDDLKAQSNKLKAHAGDKLNEARPQIANRLQKFSDNNIDRLQDLADDKVNELREWDGPANDGAVDEAESGVVEEPEKEPMEVEEADAEPPTVELTSEEPEKEPMEVEEADAEPPTVELTAEESEEEPVEEEEAMLPTVELTAEESEEEPVEEEEADAEPSTVELTAEELELLTPEDCRKAACAVKKETSSLENTNTQIVMQCFSDLAGIKEAQTKYC